MATDMHGVSVMEGVAERERAMAGRQAGIAGFGSLIITADGLRVIVKREIEAPRQLVWDAWTKPEHVAVWWGYPKKRLDVCEIDFRVGGSYRYVQRGDDGRVLTCVGVYHEIVAAERLVYSQVFDAAPYEEHAMMVEVSFEAISDRRTGVAIASRFETFMALQAFNQTVRERPQRAALYEYATLESR